MENKRRTILPLVTSEDISQMPDQASYKINRIAEQLLQETIMREEGEGSGGEALQEEKQARIDGDEHLQAQIDTLDTDKLELILSTTDIGEGVPLAANTLYGVYQ